MFRFWIVTPRPTVQQCAYDCSTYVLTYQHSSLDTFSTFMIHDNDNFPITFDCLGPNIFTCSFFAVVYNFFGGQDDLDKHCLKLLLGDLVYILEECTQQQQEEGEWGKKH